MVSLARSLKYSKAGAGRPIGTTKSPKVKPPSYTIKKGNHTLYVRYQAIELKDGTTVYHKRQTIRQNEPFMKEQKKKHKQNEEIKKKLVRHEIKQGLIDKYNLDTILQLQRLIESGQLEQMIQATANFEKGVL